jgi:hypothetical protein
VCWDIRGGGWRGKMWKEISNSISVSSPRANVTSFEIADIKYIDQYLLTKILFNNFYPLNTELIV